MDMEIQKMLVAGFFILLGCVLFSTCWYLAYGREDIKDGFRDGKALGLIGRTDDAAVKFHYRNTYETAIERARYDKGFKLGTEQGQQVRKLNETKQETFESELVDSK
jgi:hypothetical protein